MAYEIEFDPEAVKDLRKLDRSIQARLLGFLRQRVAPLENPRDLGEALTERLSEVTGSIERETGESFAISRTVD